MLEIEELNSLVSLKIHNNNLYVLKKIKDIRTLCLLPLLCW